MGVLLDVDDVVPVASSDELASSLVDVELDVVSAG